MELELEQRLSSDGLEVPCAKAYLRQFQSRQGDRKTSDEVILSRYAVWKDAPGRTQSYVPGQYPSLDDLAPGPYASLRESAVRYYGQTLPRRRGVEKKVVKAQPTGWRQPIKGVLQQLHLAREVHHILPVVVLWQLAKSMLQTIVVQTDTPDAQDTQVTELTNKMKLAGFYLSDELAQLVVEHHHNPDCTECQPSGPLAFWSLDDIERDTKPAEQRAVQAAAAAGVAAADQAALLPYAKLIREEERRLMTCLIPNSQRLVFLDMLPADVAGLLQMNESERQAELTRRVQQTDTIQPELRLMFEEESHQQQQQQPPAGNGGAAQQAGVGEAQQQQQQQEQADNVDVAQ